MGRGGGGGGSRGGGGGSRSHSSSRSSSGSRASFSSGRSRGYGTARSSSSSSRGQSSFGGGPVRPGGMGMGPRRRGFGYGGYGGPMGYGGYGYGLRRAGGCGCLSGISALIALLIAVVLFVPASCLSFVTGRMSSSSSTSSTNHTSSGPTITHTREKLAADACVESDQWIDDQAGWLDNPQKVIDGMRSFYEQTGVQPYLVIADSINGSKSYTADDVEKYLRARYDELFEDDGHLILLFCEPYENEYDPYLLVGKDAQQVVDTEGENVIYEAIDWWYTDQSLTDDAYFARIFVASANAMMRGTDFSEFG